MDTILFIILPYLTWTDRSPNNTRSILAFPYGVSSIASYVKDKARVSILDLNLYAWDEIHDVIAQTLEKDKPDVVGISMMFDSSYKYLDGVAKQIKEYDGGITVVLGGCSATVSWDTIPGEQEYVDAVCYGEGERPIREFLMHHTFDDPVWVTRDSLLKKKIPKHSYVENLNDVIDIDYSLIETARYGMKEAFSPFSSVKDNREMHQFYLVTSRGCPFNCVFCSGKSLHGREIRYADVDVLINHVRYLVDRYRMNVLTIYDDQLLFNRERAKEFFRRLAEFNLRVETPNGVSVKFIDKEMALLMKEAGMDTIPLAIESGSERMLKDVIHKPLMLKQVKPVVEYLHSANIFVQGYFVVGIPGETVEDRVDTVRFIKEVELDWSGFNLATPLRGSDLFRICRDNGYIDREYRLDELGMHEYVIRMPGVNPEDIKRERYLMNLDVNFVNNRRMRIGDYEVASLCFKDVNARYENHAFAHYFLAKALYCMDGDVEQYHHAVEKVKEMVRSDRTWGEYFKYFDIEEMVMT